MDVHLAIADAYRAWAAGQPDEVKKTCRQVLRLHPRHPGALHLLGLLAEAAGDTRRAAEYLEQACAVAGAPDFLFHDLFEFYRRHGRPADAVDAAWRELQRDTVA